MVQDENEVVAKKEELTVELGTFHFIFPVGQRVTPVWSMDGTDDDEDDDDDEDFEVPQAKSVTPPHQ